MNALLGAYIEIAGLRYSLPSQKGIQFYICLCFVQVTQIKTALLVCVVVDESINCLTLSSRNLLIAYIMLLLVFYN